MLERIQAFANIQGLLTVESLEVFDADIVTDPITDKVKRGPLRKTELPTSVKQEIVDFINDKLSGKNKSDERLTLSRQKEADLKAAEIAAREQPARGKPASENEA